MKRIPLIILALIIFWFSALFGGIQDKLGVGFSVTTQKLFGDTRNGDFNYGGNPLVLRYNWRPSVYFETEFGYGQLSTDVLGRSLDTNLYTVGGKIGYRLFHRNRLTPLVYLGLGAMNFKVGNGQRHWDGYGLAGTGAEFFATPSIGLNLTADFRYTTGDDFDGSRVGAGKDAFFNLGAGLNFYFGAGHERGASHLADAAEMDDAAARFEQVGAEAPADDASLETAADVEELRSEQQRLLRQIEEREDHLRLLELKAEILQQELGNLQQQVHPEDTAPGDERAFDVDDDLTLRFQNGLALYQAQHFDRAASTFEAILVSAPSHPEAATWWYWLGESRFAEEAFHEAAAAFERALSLNRDRNRSGLIRLMLALSRWKGGDTARAYTDLEELVRSAREDGVKALALEYLAKVKMEWN